MAHTVIGMFDSASEAQQAVQQLVSSGISRDNIDISSGNSGSSGNYSASSSDTGYTSNTGDSGTTAGSGSLGYPGTGSFTESTTGRMTDDLTSTTGLGGSTGMGMAGTTDVGSAGFGTGSRSSSTDLSDLSSDRRSSGSYDNDHKESGITRFFKSLFGGNDDDVNTYSNVAQRSGSIVTVHAQSKEEAERAADILDDNGAVDVNEKASQYGVGSSTSSDRDTYTGTGTTEGSSINVIEEQLEVGKRQVQTGGVRLRSRIVETPVEESLRLREERVTVERNPVNRPATDADFASFKETSIELTEQAEVPVVSKQARVVEEISLDKQVTERDETIRDTVRSTEVDVENLENKNTRTGSSSTSSDSDFLDKKNNF